MFNDISLWGLFLSALISSTLFPGGSEVVLGALAAQGQHGWVALLAVASLGNTLGALTTWWLGFLLARRLPLEGRLSEGRRTALARVRRWGSPVLLLSWLPVLGDPLCFAAGYLRLPLAASLLFMALGKTARYAMILFVFA